jgi:hypothetical protein
MYDDYDDLLEERYADMIVRCSKHADCREHPALGLECAKRSGQTVDRLADRACPSTDFGDYDDWRKAFPELPWDE